MTPSQEGRIVTVDDVRVEVFVKTFSVTAPPPSIIQSKKHELEFKA